jgi:hypothetical protein
MEMQIRCVYNPSSINQCKDKSEMAIYVMIVMSPSSPFLAFSRKVNAWHFEHIAATQLCLKAWDTLV